jgi:hypothetical protein
MTSVVVEVNRMADSSHQLCSFGYLGTCMISASKLELL